MRINAFLGVNLYEREDIDNNSSQWNSNCYYDKGLLRLEHFDVDKKSKKSKIFEREYELGKTINEEGEKVYEGQYYEIKGYLAFEHEGDGVGMIKHGIPKPTVRLYFDYNNDADIPNYYHNILDSLYNDSYGVLSKDLYDAIVKNLDDSDMVAECDIAITYSGPYGESGMTRFKIANNMPYFFLEIVLFDKLNKTDSYDSYKNIKYLNVYVKYEFMTDYMLLDRYDFEVTDTKPNTSPGNRNRYKTFDPNSSAGLDFRYPFIEFGEIDYPFLGGEEQTTENVLWYFSGFFGYESDEKPALQWFIPNKLIAAVPKIETEQQTYIADEDIEVIDDESYDKLKEFWNSSDTTDEGDYVYGDDLISSYEYIDSRIEDNIVGTEDGSVTEIKYIEFKNNSTKDVDIYTSKADVYEKAGSTNRYYIVSPNTPSPIVYQIANISSGAGDGMSNLSPLCMSVMFKKGITGESRCVDFSTSSIGLKELVSYEVVINKYIEKDDKRLLLDTMYLKGSSKFFSFDLKDCIFDDDGEYLYQVWLKDSSFDGGYMLLQEVDFKSWKDYRDGVDEFYDVYNAVCYFNPSFEGEGYEILLKDNVHFKVEADEPYDLVYTKGYNGSLSPSNVVSSSAKIFQRGRHKGLTAKDSNNVYQLYGSAAKSTGADYPSYDGGFSTLAEFYNDGEWKLHIAFNPSSVIDQELYSDFQDTIDLTIQTIDYNYKELNDLVKYGVAIECPNNFNDMYQKKVVSKHAIYMDRLFKSIDDNKKSLLYFSEQSYPESFNQANLFKMNEKILHLETFKDQLYIFKESEIEILSGSNNLTFILDEYYTDGAIEYTVIKHENQLLFTNEKGIYSISPRNYPKLLSINIQKMFDMDLLNIEYAEVLTSKGVDFYVLTLKDIVSPMDIGSINLNEFGMLLEKGAWDEKGLEWVFRGSQGFAEDVNERFGINKIAVCLRDNTIWFGTEKTSDEFLWKSAEFVQESFFKLKSFKRLALDFAGKVSTVFSKNRKVPVTFKRLPMPGAASALGESTKSTMKYTKDMPTDWTVDGQRSYSNSVIFLSEHKNTILYKWEVLESGYDNTNN